MTTLIIVIHLVLVLVLRLLVIITAILAVLSVRESGLWSGALDWGAVLGTSVLVGEELWELTATGVDEPVGDLVCDILVI